MTADNLEDALYERFPKNLGSEPDLRAAISREVRRLVRTDPPPDLAAAMREWARRERDRDPEGLGLQAEHEMLCHTHGDVRPGWLCNQGCDLQVVPTGVYTRLSDER